jgi:leucyl aminopeptidase
MTVQVLDKNEPEALLIPLAQSAQLADQLLNIAQKAGIDGATLQNDFKAETKEITVLYPSAGPQKRVYLIGLGKKTGIADITTAARSFCFRNKTRLPAKLGIDLRHFPVADIPRAAEAAVSGMLLGLHETGMYRTEKTGKPAPLFGTDASGLDVLVPTEALPAASAASGRGAEYAAICKKLFDLLNAPGNYKTPEIMAKWAVDAGREFGFGVEVLDREQIIARGLDALYAVGKGSPYPPALILLSYGNLTSEQPLFGLVGKGVTFDTGGVSLKPSTNMHLMKSDMGGAAAVLGAFMLASRLQLPFRMVGAIAAAENMIDGQAIKPGDVIGSFSGKTIEVIDTDAEGRLVLADAIAYLLKEEKPDVLIDLATLTGSIIRALGNQVAGMFTQNDQLAGALYNAGIQSGERLWRMPMWEEYGTDLKSDVADLRNFTGKPMAESISAAKFIEHFTAGHGAWAHLDIAGTAFADSEYAQSKSGTGFGVRLLVEFMEQWSQNQPKS